MIEAVVELRTGIEIWGMIEIDRDNERQSRVRETRWEQEEGGKRKGRKCDGKEVPERARKWELKTQGVTMEREEIGKKEEDSKKSETVERIKGKKRD